MNRPTSLNKTVRLKRAGFLEQRWDNVSQGELNAIFDRAKSYDDLEYIHVETSIEVIDGIWER